MCIKIPAKGHLRSKIAKTVKFWSNMMKITNDNQMNIKCTSKDCLIHTDFKYLHKIADQGHLRSKKWAKVKFWSKMMKITNGNQMVIKAMSSVHKRVYYCEVPSPSSGRNVCYFFENLRPFSIWRFTPFTAKGHSNKAPKWRILG